MNDSNGAPIFKHVRREDNGTWGRNVWSGSVNVTNVRRYYYSTRNAAAAGDISDAVGTCGRVA